MMPRIKVGDVIEVWEPLGAHESDHGSIRAANCGVDPYLTVWWIESSDWETVADDRGRVLACLHMHRARLWRAVEKMRAKEKP